MILKKIIRFHRAFSFSETIVVVGIIAAFLAISSLYGYIFIQKAKIAQAMEDAKVMRAATIAYADDIGFYPPDYTRGDDPGFMRATPWNPDGLAGRPLISNPPPVTGWLAKAQARWNGPYMDAWPYFTPWRGKYDYNWWPNNATRAGGCVVPKGVYVGVQRNYADQDSTRIPIAAERIMLDKQFDYDECINGEAQLELQLL